MEKTPSPKLADLAGAGEIVEMVLVPTEEQVHRLCTILHKGCYVKVPCGISLRDLLCEVFSISPEYVKKDIKVMFIENSPVDNIDTALIRDGITLALSAAMPGLVGAAMRRDGLSWMRTSITYQQKDTEQAGGEGLIQLKLFNQVMADLGESFLKRGIYVKSGYFAAFMDRLSTDFWKDFGRVTLAGKEIGCDALKEDLLGRDQWLRVTIP